MKTLAENRKAYFNYQILEKFEAGISLLGQEVKSLKTRGVSLAGNYVVIRAMRTASSSSTSPRLRQGSVNQEAFWLGAKIPPYQPKNAPQDYEEERSRKLLLKKSEIKYLLGKSKQKGLTLIPLKLYTKNGKIKLEFALAEGRKKFDKREVIKKREIEREIQQTLKEQ